MSDVISRDALQELVDAWISHGKHVAGPTAVKPDLVLYRLLTASGQLLLDGFLRPANSIKEFFFPRHEKLHEYHMNAKQVELVDVAPLDTEQIIIAARPCDSAALPILDQVFNWDDQDAFYQQRRRLTTIVTLACREHDAHCFCTSAGLAPNDERGSDAMLFDLGDATYEVRCLTDKGKALFEGKTRTSDKTGQAGPRPEPRLDIDAIKRFLETGFESQLWPSLTMRCLGCGACTYTCPTCHCFDIVDEGSAAGGCRVRNWDSCQFTMFTMHASGHNPRGRQDQRQRQRIFHKFKMYRDKFGEILCTGCGNCTRHCPVSLGVRPVLEALQKTTAS